MECFDRDYLNAKVGPSCTILHADRLGHAFQPLPGRCFAGQFPNNALTAHCDAHVPLPHPSWPPCPLRALPPNRSSCG